MDEGRKRVLLIAASILAARRLVQLDFKPCPAYESAIASAIAAAEKILRRIDTRWPNRQPDREF
jgi:transposase